MKKFYFREMLLVSFRERKARKVTFHPNVTIVRGDNETGKSSLIKSILRSFGAEPAKVHPNWLNADVRSLIRFDIEGQAFALLRHGSFFAAFDSQDRLIGRFRSITNDLAPFLANLFGFGLRLPTREGQFVPLPPAYYFLPFYMDQDASWVQQWSGFDKLQQFSNWKRGVIEYHAGIRGNEYYETQAAKLELESQVARIQRKHEGLQEVYSGLSQRFEAASFNVDFLAYKAEIEELLKRSDTLRRREEGFKLRISELRNQRQSLKTQLDITNHAREESRRDFELASREAGEVQCPTCGAAYSNSFAERFAIAIDEDRCADLALHLMEELSELDKRIESELLASKRIGDELGAIERLLAKREGAVALGDLIQQEGRKELREVMSSDLTMLEREEQQLLGTISTLSSQMRQLDSKAVRREVKSFYEERMRQFLNELDVHSVSEASITKIENKIRDTGSELPRALLAYQMAVLHVIQRFSSAAFAPLVIDSPNQQDQDVRHLDRILRFIGDRKPAGGQLVLGLVDTGGIDFGGSEIVLNKKYSLLSAEDFRPVGDELQAFVDTALEG